MCVRFQRLAGPHWGAPGPGREREPGGSCSSTLPRGVGRLQAGTQLFSRHLLQQNAWARSAITGDHGRTRHAVVQRADGGRQIACRTPSAHR